MERKINQLKSPDVHSISRRLRQRLSLCEDAHIACRIEPFEQAGWSAQLQSAARVNALIRQDYPEWRIRLNLTGRTKTMALSMVLGLSGVPYEPFYCDTERDTIETLQLNKNVISAPLTDVLTVNAYLSARGLRVLSTGSDDLLRSGETIARNALTRTLAQKLPRDSPSTCAADGSKNMWKLCLPIARRTAAQPM